MDYVGRLERAFDPRDVVHVACKGGAGQPTMIDAARANPWVICISHEDLLKCGLKRALERLMIKYAQAAIAGDAVPAPIAACPSGTRA